MQKWRVSTKPYQMNDGSFQVANSHAAIGRFSFQFSLFLLVNKDWGNPNFRVTVSESLDKQLHREIEFAVFFSVLFIKYISVLCI